MLKKCSKKEPNRSCPYIVQEAGEDNTMFDSRSETESLSDVGDECESIYKSVDLPPPVSGEGAVPNQGNAYKKVDQMVYEMCSEERLAALIEECQKCFPPENFVD